MLLFQEKVGGEKRVRDIASYVVDERSLFNEKEVVVFRSENILMIVRSLGWMQGLARCIRI